MPIPLLGGNDIMVKFSRIFAQYLASLRGVVIGYFFAPLQKNLKHRKNIGVRYFYAKIRESDRELNSLSITCQYYCLHAVVSHAKIGLKCDILKNHTNSHFVLCECEKWGVFVLCVVECGVGKKNKALDIIFLLMVT